MIPEFPNFKKLEHSDQKDIEAFTVPYEPYSDFNFLTSWSWNSKWDSSISSLNHNLVFRWIYKENNQPIYSYLGTNSVTDTCDSLFAYMEERGESQGKLSYIPEVSLEGIDFTRYYIEIDINACDYIYDLGAMYSLAGNKYSQKRGRLNHFKLHYPDVKVNMLDLKNKKAQDEIFGLNKLWLDRKVMDEQTIEGEINAMNRLFDAEHGNTFCIGVYSSKLIGYAIYSSHDSDFVINHFVKADISYKGVYEFIMQESAAYLIGKGFKYLNHLEDLGLDGLRKAKMTYRPTHFLKKYHVNKL